MTIRSLLAHVGVDVEGKDIYVGDELVDKVEDNMPHEKSVSAIVSTEHGVFEIGDGDYMDNAEPMGILPGGENHEIVNAGKLPIELHEESNFRSDLQAVINKHSREDGSNTPDFILANYLVACLAAFDTASRSREEFYNIRSVPAHGTARVTGRNTPLGMEIRRDVPPMSENQGSCNEPDLSDFFNPDLPEELKKVSIRFYDLAGFMLGRMPASAQRAQGLWDLLRAKDCAVRAWRYRNVRVGYTEDESDGSST